MTRRIAIDFAPVCAARGLARAPLSAWLVLAVGLLLCLAAGVRLLQLVERAARLDAEIAAEARKARTARAARPAPQPVVIPPAQAKAVNHAIAKLNLPWRDVFDAIEEATSSTVALLSLEPDARKRLLRGVAESGTSEAMIAYVEDLKRQPFLTGVILTRHEINEQDPNKPLRFHFDATWSEAAP